MSRSREYLPTWIADPRWIEELEDPEEKANAQALIRAIRRRGFIDVIDIDILKRLFNKYRLKKYRRNLYDMNDFSYVKLR